MPRFTAHTITSLDELNAQIEQAVRDGFASAIEELEDGLNAIAAPVRDHTGAVVAALTVSGPAYRFDRQTLSDAAPEMIRAAAAISHRMGFLD
jgi:DNA-binding IclR family transcriptional regulator